MRNILVGILLAASLSGVSAGQSSTDNPSTAPAKTDEAAKPKKPKAKHVYTNEDIPERPPDSSSSNGAASGASSASVTGATGAAPEAGTAKDDSAKAKGAKPGKSVPSEEIKAAQAKVDALKQEEKGISTVVEHIEKLIAEGGEYRRSSMGDGLRKQQSDLADAKKRREAAEQQLNDLQAPK